MNRIDATRASVIGRESIPVKTEPKNSSNIDRYVAPQRLAMNFTSAILRNAVPLLFLQNEKNILLANIDAWSRVAHPEGDSSYTNLIKIYKDASDDVVRRSALIALATYGRANEKAEISDLIISSLASDDPQTIYSAVHAAGWYASADQRIIDALFKISLNPKLANACLASIAMVSIFAGRASAPEDVLESSWLVLKEGGDLAKANTLYFLARFPSLEIPKLAVSSLTDALFSENEMVRDNAFALVKKISGGSGIEQLMENLRSKASDKKYSKLKCHIFRALAYLHKNRHDPDLGEFLIKMANDKDPAVRSAFLDMFAVLCQSIDPFTVCPTNDCFVPKDLATLAVAALNDESLEVAIKAAEVISKYRDVLGKVGDKRALNDAVLSMIMTDQKYIRTSVAGSDELNSKWYVESEKGIMEGTIDGDLSWLSRVFAANELKTEALMPESDKIASMWDLLKAVMDDLMEYKLQETKRISGHELGILISKKIFCRDGSYKDQAEILSNILFMDLEGSCEDIRKSTISYLIWDGASPDEPFAEKMRETIMKAKDKDEQVMAAWVLFKMMSGELTDQMFERFRKSYKEDMQLVKKNDANANRRVLFLLCILRSLNDSVRSSDIKKMSTDFLDAVKGENIEVETGIKIFNVAKKAIQNYLFSS